MCSHNLKIIFCNILQLIDCQWSQIKSKLLNLEIVAKPKNKNANYLRHYKKMASIWKALRTGFEKGEQKGLKTGEVIGEKKKGRKMIVKALKLGTLSVEEIAEMAEVDVAYVLEIKEQLGQA